MTATPTIICVTPDLQLELPPEIQAQLTPGDRYQISITNGSILLKKVQPTETGFADLWQRLEELGLDPDQPSDEEICAMVKAVRREMAADANPH